jgi:hypothetical protein
MKTQNAFWTTTIAASAAVLAMSVLSVSPAAAQNPPPGGSGWAIPDLKAASLEFTLLQQYDGLGTKGRVRIRGVVTNCKGGVYDGTAYAALYEQVGGQWRRVDYQKIPPLSTGAVCEVAYERDWDKNAPPAAAYRLAVELGWGDPRNAADNLFNNELIRGSAGLSALLHPVMQANNSLPGGAPPKMNWPKAGSSWDKFRRIK